MIKHVLFDLDGTLTDPAYGITKSVQYALKQFGIDEPNLKELEKFIGPPLVASFKEFYGFSQEKTIKAIAAYHKRYTTVGIDENVMFEGIPELLSGLQKQGKTLHLATSKPTQLALHVLNRFNIRQYFYAVHGTPMEYNTLTKSDVVRTALQHAHIDVNTAIMVGDRKHDIIGAKENGLDTIAVLFGYGSTLEFKDAGAKYIAATVEELGTLLANLP